MILIIDDDPSFIRLLEMHFSGRHHIQPRQCFNVAEALTHVDEYTKAVFFDHMLSRGGDEGYELHRHLTGQGILLFSTTTDDEIGQWYERSGVIHIGKDPERVIQQILLAEIALRQG